MLFVPPSMPFMAPEAEAAHHEVIIENAAGSASNQECAPDCFIPNPVTVSLGTIVTWSNTDTAAHTATSGIPADGAIFDSSLIMAGGSYSYTFDEAGTYEYECMVHPWMEGTIIVEDDTTPPVLLFATGGMGGQATEIPSGGLLTVDATNSTGQNAYFGVFEDGEEPLWTRWISATCSASPEPTYTTRDHYTGPKLEDDPSSWWRYGATFPIGTTTVTCTATDDDGNVGTASLTINVILPNTPVITFCYDCWNNEGNATEILSGGFLNVTATNSTGQNAYFGVYTDGENATWSSTNTTCSASPEPTYTVTWTLRDDPSNWWKYGATFPIGITTVTCTATNDDGNVGTASFDVAVDFTIPPDTTPPVIDVPADFTIIASNSSGYLEFENDPPDDKELVSGGYCYKWRGCGGTAFPDGIIVRDPPDQYGQSSYIGYLSPQGPMSFCDPPIDDLFPIGTTTVTCTATWYHPDDNSENVVTASFNVTVEPLTPTVTATAYLNDTSSTGRTFAVTASNLTFAEIKDTVWKDGVGVYSLSPPWPPHCIAGEDFALAAASAWCWMNQSNYPWWGVDTWQVEIPEDWEAGTYEVHLRLNWTSDSVVSFTVPALADTTLPVITFRTGGMGGQATEIPSGGLLTVDATNSTGQNAYFGIFCSFPQYDSYCMENNINVINTTCSASPEPTYTVAGQTLLDDPSSWWRYGATFPIGTTTVTCTGTDEDGNVGTASLTINVILPESSDTTPPEEEIVVPDWIKFNAGWWASGQISDDEFVEGLQWLISNGIMNIPPTEQGAGSDSVIPSWIKSNAEWWANDLIDDRNFVTGLQWLITNGIMIIG